jgi:glycosyltransferase involved in cell wall biosynthesis
MSSAGDRLRVLYSFPHKLGADRICYTAWQEVNGLAAAGAEVLLFPGVLHRPVAASVEVRPTLAWKKLRVSYKLLGKMRALALHDHIVAKRVEKLAGQVDIIHAWPVAALETLKAAARLGIPTVLERPNAHTRFAFETVKKEFDRLGVNLPPNDEYYYRGDVLEKEEAEYEAADYILCPSDFVVRTFVDQGISRSKLLRHTFGFDQSVFYPSGEPENTKSGLRMLFVGVCAVRKGLHFALEAWLKSPASRTGTFLIAGEFLTAYSTRLSQMLSHPSVKVLGQRNDVPQLMRNSDILVLPSIEEGFGLVIAEAIGSGCVPLASEACTEICRHMENGLVHPVGDVEALAQQITMLHEDRTLLGRLRTGCLRTAHEFTWTAAGVRLLQVYREAVSLYRQREGHASVLADSRSTTVNR